MLWFYADKWSAETKSSLQATQNAGSNTRKLCRLLKSFDCIYMIQQKLKKKHYFYDHAGSGGDSGGGNGDSATTEAESDPTPNSTPESLNEVGQVYTEHEDKLLNSMDILTQALWVLFMYYDNQIVMTRLKLFPQILGLDPRVPDRNSNKFWFAADVTTLGSACYRYYLYCTKHQHRVSVLESKLKLELQDGEGSSSSNNGSGSGSGSICGSASSVPSVQSELDELFRLHKKRSDHCIWQIMKVVCVYSVYICSCL